MIFRLLGICVLFILGCVTSAIAQYEINGQINLSSEWQPQIFLSTINKLDDYYNANPEDIIQVGKIEQDGSFTLKGDNLPLEYRFYRLYLIKEENSEFDACLYLDEDDQNYIHLILDNTTKVEVIADKNHFAPFGNYSIVGDSANKELCSLSQVIFPSFHFHQIKFPTELQFSQQKLNRDLFEFADSSKYIMVSLAAMIHTDMDQYYEAKTKKYEGFGQRLSAELNNHGYTEDYLRKLNYYNGGLSQRYIPNWVYLLLGVLAIGLLISILKIIALQKRLKLQFQTNPSSSSKSIPSITKQEEKILSLILLEKSNKEIASDLFIELSTVKTHINKLYSKLGVKNRSEAKSIAKTIQNQGV